MTTQSSPVTEHQSPVTILNVPLAQLRESPLNARKNFNKEKLQELADSIREKGVLTPLLVRPPRASTQDPAGMGPYEILAGARRFRASKIAGLDTVPCMVRDDIDDATALEIITIENLQREDLSELEEAQGFKALLDLGKYNVAELAQRVGKSASYVYQRVKLVELAPEAKKALLEDKISAGHAILIARLQPQEQKRVLEIAAGDKHNHPASVRELGDWIQREIHLGLKGAPWKLDDAKLLPKAGACDGCPKREKEACLDPACYEAKMRAHFDQIEVKSGLGSAIPLCKISTQYGDLEDGVFGAKAWRPAKPGSCDAYAIGLAIDAGYVGLGDSNQRLARGQQIGICINPKCQVHWKPEARSSNYGAIPKTSAQKAKERKERAIGEARMQAICSIAGKLKWPLSVAQVRAIALAFLDRQTHDARKLLCKSLEIELKADKMGSTRPEALLKKRLADADANELAGLLVAQSVTPAYGRWGDNYYGDANEKAALYAAGKAAGINVAFLEGNAVKAAALKAKSHASAKPVAARGKPKRKPQKAA